MKDFYETKTKSRKKRLEIEGYSPLSTFPLSNTYIYENFINVEYLSLRCYLRKLDVSQSVFCLFQYFLNIIGNFAAGEWKYRRNKNTGVS